MNYRIESWFQQQRARFYHRRGLDAISKGNLQDAIARLTRALPNHPRPARIHLALGNIHWQQGDIQGAIADFSQAILCDPTCTKAYGNRALLRAEQGYTDSALADWQQGLLHSPNNAVMLYNRGLFYLQQQQLEAALADLNRALEIDPNLAEAYFHRGNLLSRQGHWEAAIKDWELAVCNDLRLDQAKDYLRYAQQVNQQHQLSQQIQQALAMPDLNIDVEKNGPQLEIAVHRPKGTGINYMTLPDRIRSKLVPLQIPGVRQFKLIGKVGEQNFPEWQQIYKLYQNLPCPPTYLRRAWLTALCLFPPFGIPALMYSLRVRRAYRRGDYPTAMLASKAARTLCVTGSALMSGLVVLSLGYVGADRLKSWVQSMDTVSSIAITQQLSVERPSLPESSAHTFQRADESKGYLLDK